MKSIIAGVKGARDFYPEDMAARSWLYRIMKMTAESYGYQEYDGPFLEKIDLYAAKSGEELVKEQAFVFPDRGGELITLRPELTPSLARMVAQKQNEMAYPLRWWSFGPFWRYERPQKGRTREFFQWNVDMIGVNSPECDAELVSICAAFFAAAGLTPDQVVIKVNNRRLMDAALAGLGVTPELRPVITRLIDRRDKMRPPEWDAFVIESGLTIDQLAGLKDLLSNADLWRESPELTRFFAVLDGMGLRDYVRYDAGIIRGLDYYTGTVFEAFDAVEGGRAILGGGHYDNLVGDVGGDPLPGVGFAMGDVVIGLVLKKFGLLPDFSRSNAPVLVTVFDQERLIQSYTLAASLRRAGVYAITYPEAAKLPKQFKYADRIGVNFVVVIGPDEDAQGKATLKDLAAHEQVVVNQADLAASIKERLAQARGV